MDTADTDTEGVLGPDTSLLFHSTPDVKGQFSLTLNMGFLILSRLEPLDPSLSNLALDGPFFHTSWIHHCIGP